MTLLRTAVLRPGDWVHFDGGEYQAIALSGTSIRLHSEVAGDTFILAAHLMASPGFAVIDGAPAPSVESVGLLDSLPAKVLEAARSWERHLVEVKTGLPPDAWPGVKPRACFDPMSTTVSQREEAKAAELGVSVRTVQLRRARSTRQGLWGLVDQRAARVREATGRVDTRLVAAVREVIEAETDTSTGTRSRLIRRATKKVEGLTGPGSCRCRAAPRSTS